MSVRRRAIRARIERDRLLGWRRHAVWEREMFDTLLRRWERHGTDNARMTDDGCPNE